MSSIREVLANFNIDVDATQVDTAQKRVQGLGKTVQGAGKSAPAISGLSTAFKGLAGYFAVGAAKDFLGGLIEQGSRVKDLSDKLGVGTDELQSFQYATGLSGVDSEGAAQALGFLNKNVGEAIGGSSELASAFAKLGVATKDSSGKVRPMGELIPDIAEGIAGLGSSQEQTAAAMKLFGKSGAALLPFLKGGRKGVAELSAEFKELGGGLSKESIDAADRAGDELDRLQFSLKGVGNQIMIAVLPLLTKAATYAIGMAKDLAKLAKESTLLQTGFAALAAVAAVFAGEMLLAALPTVALVAGLGLLYLIGDDLFALFTGKKSFLGDALGLDDNAKSTPQTLTDITGAARSFLDVLTALKPVTDALGSAMSALFSVQLKLAIQEIKTVAFGLHEVMGGVAIVVERITQGIASGLEKMADLLGLAGKAAQVAGFGGLGDKLFGAAGSVSDAGASVEASATSQREKTGGGGLLNGLGRMATGLFAASPIGSVASSLAGVGQAQFDGAAPVAGVPKSAIGANGLPAYANLQQENKVQITIQGNATQDTVDKITAATKDSSKANAVALAAMLTGG